ncbi:MAG TPA: sigma 54-interacting transcriptional regulator [Burkholderiales bacterium]|nr:sigma 54-interacting transcriptional regulator [Burkholderiales bacterium]
MNQLQSLIDAQENPFVLIDDHYRIVAANRAYCLNYGLKREEVVGKRCHQVSHLSDVPCHLNGEDCPHHEVFKSGKVHEVTHVHFDRHHGKEYVRIKGHPISGSGGKRYLGEAIFRIAGSDELDSKELKMIGGSPAFLSCLDHLKRAAQCEASVLLLGESGVGKELAAQYIHLHSSRSANRFLALNCASIPENLFEDELFGHERGAFTGCIGRKPGLFELADGGMLFLDEVGELPSAMQAKLLRVLETGEFRRLGGVETIRADVRLVFATNRDLLAMAKRGDFRLDLYYRIAAIDVRLPSLRERRSDIPSLVEALLARMTRFGMPSCRITGEAMEKLLDYSFPGNVRELGNILLKAAALCNNGAIGSEHIRLDNDPMQHVEKAAESGSREDASITRLEAAHIAELLAKHEGHRRKAADALGISERTLYRKIKRYDLA